jgi:hypothetical protein
MSGATSINVGRKVSSNCTRAHYTTLCSVIVSSFNTNQSQNQIHKLLGNFDMNMHRVSLML